MAGIVAAAQTVTVPFVGCESLGQAEAHPSPKGNPVSIAVSKAVGTKLAYYADAHSLGVLGPRGWHCLGTYDSGGAALRVAPGAIGASSGPVIEVLIRNTDTSARVDIARMIARLFPSRLDFAKRIERDYELSFPRGPFASDVVTRRSGEEIEFMTPGGKEGAGTNNWVKANAEPIHGLVMLLDDTPSMLTLSMRIPGASAELRSAIIQRLRSDSRRR